MQKSKYLSKLAVLQNQTKTFWNQDTSWWWIFVSNFGCCFDIIRLDPIPIFLLYHLSFSIYGYFCPLDDITKNLKQLKIVILDLLLQLQQKSATIFFTSSGLGPENAYIEAFQVVACCGKLCSFESDILLKLWIGILFR